MVRLFLPSINATDTSIVIEGRKAHYLLSVLRSRKGDHFIAYDGRGTCFEAIIHECKKRKVIAEVVESFPCSLESPLHSILVQGILKGEKMDFVIQKSTELGITEIVPVVTERSQVRETRKTERWRAIAEEAARQSGRSVVPTVCDPVEFAQYIAALSKWEAERALIFYEEGGMSLKEVHRILDNGRLNDPVRILIGPEGGFTKSEISNAEEHGCRVASLGKRILRAETAAISAVTLVQYLFGDMG